MKPYFSNSVFHIRHIVFTTMLKFSIHSHYPTLCRFKEIMHYNHIFTFFCNFLGKNNDNNVYTVTKMWVTHTSFKMLIAIFRGCVLYWHIIASAKPSTAWSAMATELVKSGEICILKKLKNYFTTHQNKLKWYYQSWKSSKMAYWEILTLTD